MAPEPSSSQAVAAIFSWAHSFRAGPGVRWLKLSGLTELTMSQTALGGELLLQILRRAVRVLVVAKRAIGVVGFKDDDPALVIAEFDGLAVDVRAGKIRGGLANFNGQRGGSQG